MGQKKVLAVPVFTITKRMNSILDIYPSKRKKTLKKNCRKCLFLITFNRNPHFTYTILSIIFNVLFDLTENVIDILIAVSCK